MSQTQIVDTKKQLIQARKAIKKKIQMLKGERFQTSKFYTSRFQPIVEPLQTLIKSMRSDTPVKMEVKPEKEDTVTEMQKDEEDLQHPRFLESEVVATSTPASSDLTLETIKRIYNRDAALRKTFEQSMGQFGAELQHYIRDMVSDTTGAYDHSYGIRFENGTWMLGDSNVEIDEDDFIINKVRYKGTTGLYELLFMKNPDLKVVTENDMVKYKDILQTTHAHKQKYLPRGRINSNRGFKYVKIISKLFPAEHKAVEREEETVRTLTPKRVEKPKNLARRRIQSAVEGSGMQWKNLAKNQKVQYVYWNKANELVDRLRVLLAEQNSGNDSIEIHNEILSIVEELKEENIIE